MATIKQIAGGSTAHQPPRVEFPGAIDNETETGEAAEPPNNRGAIPQSSYS